MVGAWNSVGSPLLDRHTTSVALTDAGRALLPEAKNALESLDAARAAVEGAGHGLRGSIRLGTLASLTTIDLPTLAGAFRKTHPGVRLHMTAAAEGSSGLLEKLRAHRLDAAFVGVDLAPIATFRPRLLVPAGHPLASVERAAPGALAGEPFVDLPAGYCNRVRSDNDFRRAGLSRTVVVEVVDLATIPRYVEAGLGIAVVPPLRAETCRCRRRRPRPAGHPVDPGRRPALRDLAEPGPAGVPRPDPRPHPPHRRVLKRRQLLGPGHRDSPQTRPEPWRAIQASRSSKTRSAPVRPSACARSSSRRPGPMLSSKSMSPTATSPRNTVDLLVTA
ncbi:LysR substrate-binding domain-containing protein [Actinoplanes sp. NPDC023801]|uniref:LysR substrate-binding domain-containing protein n=1 Tax=Actinoplanes sp. NPDC023801 TaxID=3154595 RepID=UPI0033F6326A